MMKLAFSFSQKSVFFAVMILATACSPREIKVANHDAEIPVESVVQAPRGEDASESALSQLGKGAETAEVGSFLSNPAALKNSQQATASLKALEGFVLNGNYVEDPKFSVKPEMRKALTVWNRSLLIALYAKTPESQDYLERTLVMMRSGCDESLRGCLNIGFFKQDPASARILEESVRRLDLQIAAAKDANQKNELVRKYYRDLGLSFDLRNKTTDASFDFLYLNHAREYADSLGTVDNSQKQSIMSRHERIFETLLNSFKTEGLDTASQARFRTFVENFRPWDYSHVTPGPFSAGATQMLSYAAKYFMYDASQKNLSPSLQASVQKAAAEFNTLFESLRKTNPRVIQNLDLKNDFAKDEYFYLIDRLFYGHLTPTEASAIWLGSKKNADALLKTVEKYIRVQMTVQILKTNAEMNKLYANRANIPSQALFNDVVTMGNQLTFTWTDLLTRIQALGTFVDRHMKSTASEDYRRVDTMLTSLGSNIKLLSVYPNMMMISYFMESMNSKLRIFAPGGRQLEIDAETIIALFLDGQLPPFFNFGNDNESIQRLQTLHAFYFSLKTETFNAFSMNEAERVDEVQFFEKVIAKYLAAPRRDLDEDYRAMWQRLESDSNYGLFRSICRQDNEILKTGGQVGHAGISHSLELSQLRYNTYLSRHDSSPAKAAFAFYSVPTTDAIAKVNASLRQRLLFVETMINILEKHFEALENAADPSARAGMANEHREKIAKIKAIVNQALTPKTLLMTEIFKRHLEISNCLTQTVKIELDRQMKWVAMEEAFLRDVYRQMQAARGSDSATFEALDQQYPVTLPGEQLPSGFRRRDKVTAQEYSSNTLDFLLRARVFMSKIAPNLSIKLPPDLMTSDLWTAAKDAVLPGDISEEEFVRMGLSRFNSNFFMWSTFSNDFEPLRMRLNLMIELYRLGSVDVFDWTKPGCATSPVDTKCATRKVKISAKDVLKELRSTIELISLSENGQPKPEVALLSRMGVTNRFGLQSLQKFFLNTKNEKLTFAETLFTTISDDAIALREALAYYTSESATGNLLFATDTSVRTAMRSHYAPLVNETFARAEEFLQAITEMEKEDAQSGRILELGYEIGANGINAIEANKIGGVPVYIDRTRVDDLAARKAIFHADTHNFFVEKSAASGAR